MPSVDYAPAVAGDDGHVVTSTSAFTSGVVRAGFEGRNAFLRLLPPSGQGVPQGVQIDVAHLTLTRKTTGGVGSANTDISGVAEDDHVAPTTLAEWQTDNGILTVASVAFDISVSSSGTDQTPSLVSVIQEIVDRAGYAAGNAIGIQINGDGTSTTYQEWEHVEAAGTAHAVLHIEYIEATGGLFIPSIPSLPSIPSIR